MKSSSNSLTLIAIVCSILLLLVLEIFWLRMEYQNEHARFQRETHMILRNTVFELNDSLINKRILVVSTDEVEIARTKDSTRNTPGRHLIQIWVDSSHLPRQSSTREGNSIPLHTRSLMLKLGLDSLDREVIEKKYLTELNKAGLPLPHRVIFLNQHENTSTPLIISEELVATPSGIFKLEFNNLSWLLIMKIAPQISFSLLLSLLVIGSFMLLYRNLLLQQRLVVIKNDLISNISHELKTPITTVGVALEGLKNFKGLDDPVVSDEYIAIAENELKRLTVLTDKILNASLGDHSGQYLLSEIDFAVLVNEVAQSFKLVTDKNGVALTLQINEGSFKIAGDPDHLSNMLFNLLDNALKYRSEEPMITISLTTAGNQIYCKVEDNGIGIPEVYQKKVFEKFFRVPTGDLHTVKGYGLGLSYVQQVTAYHKGEIKIESELNRGSIFTVMLPKIS